MGAGPCTCPTCNVALTRVGYQGILLDKCPQCGGLWFDSGEIISYMNAVLAEHPDLDVGHLTIHRAIPWDAAPSGPSQLCPRCRESMQKLNYAYDSNIFLDRCSACGGLWAKRSQLAPLARYIKGHPKLDKLGASMVEHDREQQWMTTFEDDLEDMKPWSVLLYLMPIKIIVPIGDTAVRKSFPWVTVCLFGANILAYGYQFFEVEDWGRFFLLYGFVPAHIASGEDIYTLITSMFLHGNVIHLLGNMLFLYIFGDNVEDAFGHLLYPFFYLLCGVCGSGIYLLAHSGSALPCIGASGAISGVLGAYFVFYPTAGVRTFFIYRIITIPAVIYLGLWFSFQGLWSIGEVALAEPMGVAVLAHVGGFVSGAAMALLLRIGFRTLPSNVG